MPITVVPSNPTAETPVVLTFRGFHRFCSNVLHAVSGNIISIEHHWECAVLESFEEREVAVGIRPAGTYQVRFVSTPGDPDTEFIPCGSFTVAPGVIGTPIPVLADALLLSLAAMLSIAGAAAAGRIGK